MSMMRSRWAAAGAAVAVALGAGGVGLVAATNPADAVTFVPIEPCRVVDTRPDFQVGPRNAPLGGDETLTVTAVGTAGECNAVPAGATGVALNVTAVDATLLTFLTIWPTGSPQPNASSLNPAPGQPPTPNAVTTGLDTSGRFDVYNFQGSVHVVIDIVGYYAGHDHDDRYYPRDEADAAFVTPDEALSIALQADFQARSRSLPGSAFQARRPAVADSVIDPFGALYVFSGTNDSFEAPVDLPDGAWIGALHAWVEDSVFFASPEASLTVQLRQIEHDGAYEVLLSLGSLYQPSVTELTATPDEIIVVDNSQYSYVVSVDVVGADWSTHGDAIRLKAAVVDYLGPS